MMKFHALGVTILVALAWGLAAGQTPASGPSQNIDELVLQLDSNSWKNRQLAQNELVRLGAKAAGPLKAAIKGGKLQLEGSNRATWILAQVDVPESGAVWRETPHVSTPEGFKDGDVVTACNDFAVRCQNDLYTVCAGNEKLKLTVWRKGQGSMTVETSWGELEDAVGMALTWPDPLEMFDRFAKGEQWDGQIRQAIKLHNAGDPKSAKELEDLWNAGCRNMMLASVWMNELLACGQYDRARQVWQDKISKAPAESYPGGLWQYGMIPFERAHLELATGHPDEARKILEAAAQDATKADAWMGLAKIRYAQEEMKLALESPAEALKLWREVAPDIRHPQGLDRRDLMPMLAQRLAAGGQPEEALKFLDAEPDSVTKSVLTKYYKQQVELAAGARNKPAAGINWVFAKWVPWYELWSDNNGWFSRLFVMQNVQPPIRLECEMRIVSFPAKRTNWMRVATAWVAPMEDERGTNFVRIFATGESQEKGLGTPKSMATVLPEVLAADQWHKATMEITPNCTRCSLDGLCLWTSYHDPVPGEWRAAINAAGCHAEYRNVKLYVAADHAVDNAAMEKNLLAFEQAQEVGDLPKTQAAAKALNEVFKDIPAAKPIAAEVSLRLRMFEDFMSPQGLNLCEKDLVAFGQTGDLGWILKDGWLQGVNGSDGWHPELYVRMPYRDFELKGLMRIAKFDANSHLYLVWGASKGHAKNFLCFEPDSKCVMLSGEKTKKRGGEMYKAISSADGPAAFCVRVIGKNAAMFVEDGAKPLGVFGGVENCGDEIGLYTMDAPQGAISQYGQLNIRHVDPKSKIDDPATMPKIVAPPPLPPPEHDAAEN